MPKWWATSWTTVIRTCSTTSSSVRTSRSRWAPVDRDAVGHRQVRRSRRTRRPARSAGRRRRGRAGRGSGGSSTTSTATLSMSAPKPVGDAVEGVGHQVLEALRAQVHGGGTYRPPAGRTLRRWTGDDAARRPRRGPAGRRHQPGRAPRASSPAPARARPGSSPAASPTGPPPATSTPATCSPSPSPARRRASCGRRLRRLGLRDDVAAGTFHAVAYAQLRARWADRGAEPPRLLDRKVALRRPTSSAAGRDTAQRRRGRDRVGQGPADQPRRTTLEPGGPGRAPPAAARRRDAPTCSTATPRPRPRPGWSTSTTCSRLTPPDHGARRPGSPPPSAGASGTSSSTSSRTSTRSSTGCSRPGWATATTCAWSATPTRPSTAGTAPTPATSTASRRPSPSTASPASRCCTSGTTTAPPPRSSPRPPPSWPTEPPGRPPPRRAPADGRRAHADDAAEARAIARAVRDRHGPGRPWSTQAVLVRTNAQAAVITEALGRVGHPPPAPRRRPAARPGPPSPTPWPGSAGSATRPCWPTSGSPPVDAEGAATARTARTPPARPRRPPRPPRTGPPSSCWPGSTRRSTRRPAGPGFASWLVAAVRSGEGADRDAVEVSHLPRRQGPRVAGRAPGGRSRTASSPSATPRRRRPWPRSSACSTSPSPGPRRSCACTGPAPGSRAARPGNAARHRGWPRSSPPCSTCRWRPGPSTAAST